MTENESSKTSVLTEIYEAYKDPVFFVEHALGHLTWGKQRIILQSVKDHEKTAVRACHGVSKTFSAAEIAVWFLNSFSNSKVITTAPTYMQVKDLLWSEIGHIYRTSRVKLDGECLTIQIKTDHSEHFAVGFSTDKPQRAEGWHAPAILFIFDEAKGIPAWLWDSVKGLITGGFYRWLAISTTDGVVPGEPYEKCFRRDSGWNTIHISAYDSPYSTGEKFTGITIPDLSRLDKFERHEVDPNDVVIQIASPKWIAECKKDWGEDSVLFNTKVRGEIDEGGSDTIIKLSQVMRMFDNSKKADFDDVGETEIGVDVARGGSDDTAFFMRQGLKVVKTMVIPSKALPVKAKTVYICDELEKFADHDKDISIKVDDTGVGGAVTDIMQDRGYGIFPINFQQEALRKKRYANAISEMWYETAKVVENISCLEDPRLQTELVNRKGGQDKRGRLVVESKDDYKKRCGAENRDVRSPDKADAFLLCFYNRSWGADFEALGEGGMRAKEEDGFASSLSGDDWERKMIDRRQEGEGKPRLSDEEKQIEMLCTPENARKYVSLMSEHKSMTKVAELMGVDESLLRRWLSSRREYINSVAQGGRGGDSGIDVW